MANYHLAVFDLDGTLLNTLDDLATAGNFALSQLGLPEHPTNAYKKFVGSGVKNLLKRAVPLEYHDENVVLQRLSQYFSDYYSKYSSALTKPYPGMTELLHDLQKNGIRSAVISNKPHQYVVDLVAQFFPCLVDVAYGQREGVPLKPDPQGLLQIMSEMNCCPKHCIYIGDSDVDILTGLSACVSTVGVTWGFRSAAELLDAGATTLANTPEDLQAILLQNRMPI